MAVPPQTEVAGAEHLPPVRTAAAQGKAHPYRFLQADCGTTEALAFIVAPTAVSREDRTATVVWAARVVLEQCPREGASIFLMADGSDVATNRDMSARILLAGGSYFPKGCGFSGAACDGVIWQLEATDQVISAREVEISRLWAANQYKEEFRNEQGDLDRARLKTFIADQLKTTPDQIRQTVVLGLRPMPAPVE
ncbi:hypothetical protein YWS52_11750 [Chitiniphilus shinanonensis]